jgi:hypothetical protein
MNRSRPSRGYQREGLCRKPYTQIVELLIGMTVSFGGVLVRLLAVPMSSCRMLLGFFVVALIVLVSRFMVMVFGCRVMRRCLQVMLGCGMLGRCHGWISFMIIYRHAV